MPELGVKHRAPRFEPSGEAVRHVFVYGTLRQGGANDITRLRPAPQYIGEARIVGQMYHLGGYPGVVLDAPGWVVGEVYAITPELELRLDEIEELYPQEKDEYFKRHRAIDVRGQSLMCIVYEINLRYVQGKPRVGSGDWLRPS